MRTLILLFMASIVSTGTQAQIKQKAAIDSLFAAWNKPDVPGCAIGIVKDGKLIYTQGYGMANLEYDIPNSSTSVFRIGSTSKQFTAACIIKLVQQGKLSLDNTLDMFYPAFPDYAKKITIRHLLNHTSGIRDYLTLSLLKGLGDDDYYTDEDVMNWLTSQTDLNFQPSEQHLYSNSGYWLLGQIVNKVSGTTMAKYAAQEIFAPLGMVNTHFHDDHNQIVKKRASGYMPNDTGYQICMTTLNLIGDGGIFSTIEDMKKWDDAYYNTTGLNKDFWQMMTQRGVLNNGDTIDYASGLVVSSHKGLKTISHGGAFVGYRADIVRFPDQRFTVIILANRSDANPTRMAFKVADIFLKDLYKTEIEETAILKGENNVPQYKPTQLVGRYSVQPGVDIDIAIESDSLQVTQLWNNSTYKIVNVHSNTYTIPGVPVQFTFTDLKDDTTQTLIILQNGSETECKRIKTVDLSNVDVKSYTGKYFCKELNVTYMLYIKDDALTVDVNNKEFASLELYAVDQFLLYGNPITFIRTKGKLTGFNMDFGRVKNLRFDKID